MPYAFSSASILADADAPSGPFYELMGLPVHPLVVHAAVVLLPLAALGLIAIFAIPALRRRIGWLVMIGLVLGVGGVYVAYESGEQLAAAIGLPERHAEFGEQVKVLAFALLGFGFLWYVVARLGDRKQAKLAASAAGSPPASGATELGLGGQFSTEMAATGSGAGGPASTGSGSSGAGGTGTGSAQAASPVRNRQSTLALILGVLMVIVAMLNLVWIVLVGHSGAEAVWAGRLPQSGQSDTSPLPSASPSVTGTVAETSYSMADVAAHATVADCWSVVDGTVYNLTSWEDKHPGGAAAIESLCGKDATSAFRGQHGSAAKPNEVLAGFAIGVIAASPATPDSPEGATAQPSYTEGSGDVTAAADASPRGGAGVYTMAEVKTHSSESDCWVVVEKYVYNLTEWGERHPGGEEKIHRLCGRDATEAFRDEHGKESEPNSVLAGYQIGTLDS